MEDEIEDIRVTTFHNELGRATVVAMCVADRTAIHSLVSQANTLDDQGQKPSSLRAPPPLRLPQSMAIMVPHDVSEGLPIEGAVKRSHLTTFNLDISHL